MNCVQEILPHALAEFGIAKKFNSYSLLVHWRNIVGEEIYSHAVAVRITNSIIWVAVSNSVWSHHLLMLKRDLIAKLNAAAGENSVHDLKFFTGNVQHYQKINEDLANNEIEPKDKYEEISLPRLNFQEINDARSKVAHIINENLRNKLFYVIIKEMALQKGKIQRNWHSCHYCGVLCAPEEECCTVCAIEQKQKKLAEIRKMLFDLPWFTYYEIKNYIDCTAAEFYGVKKRLLSLLINKAVACPNDLIAAATLVMLMTGRKPEQLSQDYVDKIIKKLTEKARRKNNVFASGR